MSQGDIEMEFDHVITEVTEGDDYWQILADGTGFGLDKKYGVQPKVGDHVKLYTVQWSRIRGMDINGVRVFYQDDDELEEVRRRERREYKEQKEKEFEATKHLLDADYETLPDEFQRRLDRFRRGSSDFRIEYEPYEMFCCKEAVKIARYCKNSKAVQRLREHDNHEEAMSVVDDGHSGNTMGAAFSLAYWYLECPPIVEFLHGALTPLVGCEEYGCTHSEEEKMVVDDLLKHYEQSSGEDTYSELRALLVLPEGAEDVPVREKKAKKPRMLTITD